MTDACAQASAATVRLLVEVNGRLAYGSGSVIRHGSRNSWVLTCAHVSQGIGTSVRVSYLVGSRPGRVRGVVERVDEALDLAVVRTARRLPLSVLDIAEEAPSLGDEVVLCGFPLDPVLTVSRATYSGSADGRYRFAGGLTMAGMSGGPVLSCDGEVVSVVLERTTDGPVPVYGLGLGSRLEDVRAFLTAPRRSRPPKGRAR